jgi:hypothetical protein
MLGPLADLLFALSWLPFALAGHVMEGQVRDLRALFAGVMFISFAHQPLTFPLVYASPWRLGAHRRMFLWFPVVAIAVIVVSTQLSMTLVAVVGGLWNGEHILMQRYGIGRLYGRKAGDNQGGIERWMLVFWFLVPLLWNTVSGALGRVLDRLSSHSVDADAARLLLGMQSEARVAFVLSLLMAALLTVRWLASEWRSGLANPGKWVYLGSTAGLFALAVVDPVAAVVGFVASHSIEYFVLVGRSVGSEARHPGPLGRMARRTHGRMELFVAYGFVTGGVFLLLYQVAPGSVLLVAVLTIGAVHFFYDAFIWKLRQPAVAESLGAASAPH